MDGTIHVQIQREVTLSTSEYCLLMVGDFNITVVCVTGPAASTGQSEWTGGSGATPGVQKQQPGAYTGHAQVHVSHGSLVRTGLLHVCQQLHDAQCSRHAPLAAVSSPPVLLWKAKRQYCSAVQTQKAVSAYFTSKQILPFAFAEHYFSVQVSSYFLLTFQSRVRRLYYTS